jgi:hypothetical protein
MGAGLSAWGTRWPAPGTTGAPRCAARSAFRFKTPSAGRPERVGHDRRRSPPRSCRLAGRWSSASKVLTAVKPRSRFAWRTAMRWAAAASGMRPMERADSGGMGGAHLMIAGASTWQISDELVGSLDRSPFSGGGDCGGPRPSPPPPVDGELSSRPDSGMGEKHPLARSDRPPVRSLENGLVDSRQHPSPNCSASLRRAP